MHHFVVCTLLLSLHGSLARDYATTPGSARLAVIGDHGLAGPTAFAVSELVKSWQPLDAVVSVGDVNYPRGSRWTIDANVGQYWSEFMYPYKGKYKKSTSDRNRFWPCPGNHDYGTHSKRDLSAYLEYMPVKRRRFYDVRIGPVHIFSLDSDKKSARLLGHNYTFTHSHSTHISSAVNGTVSDELTGTGSRNPFGGRVGGPNMSQAVWLRRRLRASTAPWKIVVFHHPPYSSGSHGSCTHMRWPFEEWGATAVLSGHEHSYERLMRGENGFPYFINGMGGARTYGFQVQPVRGSAVRYTSRSGGAQYLEANATHITFKFFSTVDPTQVIDCYSAYKQPAPTSSSPATDTLDGWTRHSHHAHQTDLASTGNTSSGNAPAGSVETGTVLEPIDMDSYDPLEAMEGTMSHHRHRAVSQPAAQGMAPAPTQPRTVTRYRECPRAQVVGGGLQQSGPAAHSWATVGEGRQASSGAATDGVGPAGGVDGMTATGGTVAGVAGGSSGRTSLQAASTSTASSETVTETVTRTQSKRHNSFGGLLVFLRGDREG